MDGAWTGHPDQNQIALDQFPFPNQLADAEGAGGAVSELAAGAGRTSASTLWPEHEQRCGP